MEAGHDDNPTGPDAVIHAIRESGHRSLANVASSHRVSIRLTRDDAKDRLHLVLELRSEAGLLGVVPRRRVVLGLGQGPERNR